MTAVELSALATLFAATFGAATVLPMQSELLFAAMQAAEAAPLVPMVAVASVGNTLGSVVNWWMGRFVERWKGSRWFPVSEAQLARGQRWYLKYGVWTLLLSWAPLGDVFTVAAGIMRTPFWLFLSLVGIAKTGRFVALAWLLS
ncbi:MAG TPA: YqaA family protein [Thermohalobaculum sp.]|nr:YqaA family protein [Thermohalobaculum sp.]